MINNMIQMKDTKLKAHFKYLNAMIWAMGWSLHQHLRQEIKDAKSAVCSKNPLRDPSDMNLSAELISHGREETKDEGFDIL